MPSIARLQRTNHAVDSATETPLETHRDFSPHRKDRQIPSRESVRGRDSTESPCPRFPPRGCFLVDLRPQSSSIFDRSHRRTKNNVRGFGKAKTLPSRASLGSARSDESTAQRAVSTRSKLLDRVSPRPQDSEETIRPVQMPGANDDEIRFTTVQVAFDLRDSVAASYIDETPAQCLQTQGAKTRQKPDCTPPATATDRTLALLLH